MMISFLLHFNGLRLSMILTAMCLLMSSITPPMALAADGIKCDEKLASAMQFAERSTQKTNRFLDFFRSYKLRQFFDSNGKFNYRPSRPLALATETGSQSLKTIRLNYVTSRGYFSLSNAIMKDYLRALRVLPALNLIVVTFKYDAETLQKWLEENSSVEERARIQIVINHNFDPTLWAQDASKPLAVENTTLLQPREVRPDRSFHRRAHRRATRSLVNAHIDVVQADLPFEGGNVIVGDKHVFIGSDIIEWLMAKVGITRQETLQAYREQFGKPVIEVGLPKQNGSAYQPIFHLDVFMAVVRDRTQPGTNNTILLQSPALMQDYLFTDKTGLTRIDRYQANVQESELSRLAIRLKQFGYNVVRIPGFFSEKEGRSFSYANAILSEGVALVPSYGVLEIDQAAYKVYRKLGYFVVPMNSSEQTIENSGAIRCVSETYREACVAIYE